jgi:lysophospholipase L1-like esterase
MAITIYFGNTPSNLTGHPGSRTTSYIQSGNAVNSSSMSSAATTDHWYIITGIDVFAEGSSKAVAILGDSITDGRGSTTNGNDRWPDELASRLLKNPSTSNVGVLNQGIGGNNVLSGGLGPTAVARFDRDILEQSGVRWVIILEGVNDIGSSYDQTVATKIINAYKEFIRKAHEKDILVYGATILPFGGSQYSSAAHEQARNTINNWIRTSGEFDAVIDFDAALRNPNNTSSLLSTYDSGDHLHLNPAGYKKMAEVIDLQLFVE